MREDLSESDSSSLPGLRWEIVRFLLSGALNTGITLVAFEFLSRALPYAAAFSVTYVLGIALSYGLNARFVFKTRKTVRSALAYPLVYVCQYLIGLFFMWVLIDRMSLYPTLALAVVVVLTLPLTFLMSRWLLRSLSN